MNFRVEFVLVLIIATASNISTEDDDDTDPDDDMKVDNDEEAIDLDMFLNEQYMPLSFIMMDGSQGSNKSLNEALARQMDDGFLPVDATGSFDKALSTMNFHRKMINKYMCNNFVANEILAEIVPVETKLQRRMLGAIPRRRHVPTEKMKFDEGSSGYKDWLTKTTSLEDVFRHVTGGEVPVSNQTSRADTPHGFQKQRESFLLDYEDDYEEGPINGYTQYKPAAINHQLRAPLTPQALPPIPPLPNIQPQPTAGSKTGFPTAPQLHDPYIGAHHVSYEPASYDKGSKALGLKDLFDIALTTLAFLSFGLFILQVLMCITLTKQQSAGMIMMPGTTGGGGTGGGEEIDMQGKRFKRAMEDEAEDKFLADLNEIARRANVVIDAFLFFEKDGGKCMRKVLCENNYYVRNRQDKQKFYLPFFGMGLAWSGVKLYKNSTSSTGVELIKASVIGMGGGNCRAYYSDCKMPKAYYHEAPPGNDLPVPKFESSGKADDDCDIFIPDSDTGRPTNDPKGPT